MTHLQRYCSAVLLAALMPLCLAAQRTSRPAPATGIRLSLPDITGPVWIYIDGRLVEDYEPGDNSPQRWTTVQTLRGFEVYNTSGLLAEYNSTQKRFEFAAGASAAQRRSLFHTWRLAAAPGPHTLDVLYPVWNYDVGEHYEHLFPYLISSTPVEVDTVGLTPVAPDLPDSWQPPVGFPVRFTVVNDICQDGGPANAARLADALHVYMGIPVVQALRAQPVPVRSGPRNVVTLALPADLGGTREFDGAEIEAIATEIGSQLFMHADGFPSYSSADIQACSQKYPQFAPSYRAAAELLDKINAEIDSFHALARRLNGQP